jgi:hypothetical protein
MKGLGNGLVHFLPCDHLLIVHLFKDQLLPLLIHLRADKGSYSDGLLVMPTTQAISARVISLAPFPK